MQKKKKKIGLQIRILFARNLSRTNDVMQNKKKTENNNKRNKHCFAGVTDFCQCDTTYITNKQKNQYHTMPVREKVNQQPLIYEKKKKNPAR